MASYEKLPSGRYRGVYRDASGKKRHTPATDRMLDALEAAADAYAKSRRVARLNSGTLMARVAWGDWWDAIMEGRVWESDHGLTLQQTARSYLMPQWRTVPLNEIVRSGNEKTGAQEWVDRLVAGTAPVDMRRPDWKPRPLSASYVQRIWSAFSWSIGVALDKEVLLASPIAGVKIPKRQKRPKKYVSPATAAKLTSSGRMRQDYADAVAFGLETGLRPGELTGLHAHRIDWETRMLTVAETYVFRQKKIRGWPKDGDARVLPLSDRALEILRRRLDGRDLRQPCGIEHMRGERCRRPLVFLTDADPRAGTAGGRPLHRDVLLLAMHNAADAAGVEPVSGYALRRGYATRLAEGGLDAFALAELMGHADVKQSQEYVQQASTNRARALAALESTAVRSATGSSEPAA
ncbi:tyrosine-type recombinase/integrase [Actinosynnema sp. NPDC004786]